jgi:hypothetical protein
MVWGAGRLSRRGFVTGAGLASGALLVACGRLPFQAQQPVRLPRIGYLGSAPSGGASDAPALPVSPVRGVAPVKDRRQPWIDAERHRPPGRFRAAPYGIH